MQVLRLLLNEAVTNGDKLLVGGLVQMLVRKLLRQHLKVWRCWSTVEHRWWNRADLHTTRICPYSLSMVSRREFCLLHHHLLLLLLLLLHRIEVWCGTELMDLGELTVKGLLPIGSKGRVIGQGLWLLKLISWVSLWMAVILGHFFFQNANHRVNLFGFGLYRHWRRR